MQEYFQGVGKAESVGGSQEQLHSG